MCPSKVDKSNLCYRCGETGHKAMACISRVRCPVCASRGLISDHRVGSDKCTAKKVGGLQTGRAVDTGMAGAADIRRETIVLTETTVSAGGSPAKSKEQVTMETC